MEFTDSIYFSVLQMHSNYILMLQMRGLLHEFWNQRPDIIKSFRLIREKWEAHFSVNHNVYRQGVVLREQRNESYLTNELRAIVLFEVERSFQILPASQHYFQSLPIIIKE
jgi:hypothetical protein